MSITSKQVLDHVDAVKEGRWDNLIESIQAPEADDPRAEYNRLRDDPPKQHGNAELKRINAATNRGELEAANEAMLALEHTVDEALYSTVVILAYAIKDAYDADRQHISTKRKRNKSRGAAEGDEFYVLANNIFAYCLDHLPSHYRAFLVTSVLGAFSIEIDPDRCPRWEELARLVMPFVLGTRQGLT